MTQPEVVVLSGVRTAIGDFGGSLKDKPPTELGAAVAREAVKRAGIQPGDVEHVVFGNVIHTDVHDMYLARVAAVNAGIPVETPALTLNRLCGSGLQAIVSAAQTIYMGDTRVAVGGGAEVMSRSQYWIPGARWGQRMGDGKIIDSMIGGLSDPFDDCHMVSPQKTSQKSGVSPARLRTSWPFKAISGQRQRLLQGISKSKYSPLNRRSKVKRWSLIPTSMSKRTQAWRSWRNCARPSKETARSQRATPLVSMMRLQQSC